MASSSSNDGAARKAPSLGHIAASGRAPAPAMPKELALMDQEVQDLILESKGKKGKRRYSLDELVSSEEEEEPAFVSADRLKREADAEDAAQIRKKMSGLKSIRDTLKKKAQGIKGKVLKQNLRMLKIKEGLALGLPRCAIKLLLVEEGLGHFTQLFIKAGYDIVDMYKKYNDVEIDFILTSVERANKFKFDVKDRVILYKMFRYRHFVNPKSVKPFKNIRTIPKIMLSKNSSRAADDADIDLKLLDSDRRRQIKRLPVYDEQAGTRMIQFEKYDRDIELVYEIKDIQTCALEWEHLDPKSLLKVDPREEVLLRRMARADRRILALMERTLNMNKSRKKIFSNLRIARLFFAYLALSVLFATFSQAHEFAKNNRGSGGGSVIVAMLSVAIESRNLVSALAVYLGFSFLFRAGTYEKTTLEIEKMKKMLHVVKRFRGRLLKFRNKTEKERSEKFDTILQDINEYFEIRQRELETEEQRKRDDELLKRHMEEGNLFEKWFEEKSKLLSIGGVPHMIKSLKESETVLKPPEHKPSFPDGDRQAKLHLKNQFEQNVTRNRGITVHRMLPPRTAPFFRKDSSDEEQLLPDNFAVDVAKKKGAQQEIQDGVILDQQQQHLLPVGGMEEQQQQQAEAKKGKMKNGKSGDELGETDDASPGLSSQMIMLGPDGRPLPPGEIVSDSAPFGRGSAIQLTGLNMNRIFELPDLIDPETGRPYEVTPGQTPHRIPPYEGGPGGAVLFTDTHPGVEGTLIQLGETLQTPDGLALGTPGRPPPGVVPPQDPQFVGGLAARNNAAGVNLAALGINHSIGPNTIGRSSSATSSGTRRASTNAIPSERIEEGSHMSPFSRKSRLKGGLSGPKSETQSAGRSSKSSESSDSKNRTSSSSSSSSSSNNAESSSNNGKDGENLRSSSSSSSNPSTSRPSSSRGTPNMTPMRDGKHFKTPPSRPKSASLHFKSDNNSISILDTISEVERYDKEIDRDDNEKFEFDETWGAPPHSTKKQKKEETEYQPIRHMDVVVSPLDSAIGKRYESYFKEHGVNKDDLQPEVRRFVQEVEDEHDGIDDTTTNLDITRQLEQLEEKHARHGAKVGDQGTLVGRDDGWAGWKYEAEADWEGQNLTLDNSEKPLGSPTLSSAEGKQQTSPQPSASPTVSEGIVPGSIVEDQEVTSNRFGDVQLSARRANQVSPNAIQDGPEPTCDSEAQAKSAVTGGEASTSLRTKPKRKRPLSVGRIVGGFGLSQEGSAVSPRSREALMENRDDMLSPGDSQTDGAIPLQPSPSMEIESVCERPSVIIEAEPMPTFTAPGVLQARLSARSRTDSARDGDGDD